MTGMPMWAAQEAAHRATADRLTLAENRLRAVEATLLRAGAPTHDAHGAKLNPNGMLVDYLAGRRHPDWKED